MTATLYHLNRHRDPSGVSGKGDDIATICEFPSGLVAMHWNSETPSVAVYTDIRHIERLHGHEGASTLEIDDAPRLLRAYQRVMRWMLSARYNDRPLTVTPHPDHPGRLRLTFQDERVWAWWIALFDGSTYAASHVEVNGEMQHTWVSPDGDLWLQHFTRIPNDEHPLETFDREDR